MADEPGDNGKLNPSLRPRKDESHDTSHRSPAPHETASVQRQEGRAWPWIWLVSAIVGLLIVLWLIFGQDI